jgi:YVTN family beta-propeller protein
VGGFPRGIGISPDGKTLFTANAVSGDVSVIDIASGKIERRAEVGGGPWGLVVAGR